ncbi:MAG: FAD-binding protein [Anaerolineales bacterium]|nr:FAD-binding protein [Anaerolineales bacterium]
MNDEIKRLNWAGNYQFQAPNFAEPDTVEELQTLVAVANKVSVLGSTHSFNDIADSPQLLLSLQQIPRTMTLDPAAATVTISSNVRYGELALYLEAQGFALPNLASLPHISVVGACATGTHGSGVGNPCLAAPVTGLTFIAADGELVTWRRGEAANFPGAVVNLGGLGVITEMELAVQPTFAVQQYVYQQLPWQAVWQQLGDIMATAYSVSLFTSWDETAVEQLWVKALTTEVVPAGPLYGAQPASQQLHPCSTDAASCTEQLGEPGPWFRRLPHFKLEYMPSVGAELQTEYLVPASHGVAALQALFELREQLHPLLYISEIRTVKADDLWLSPAYATDSLAIHFTWKPDWAQVQPLLPQIEAALAPFYARPHWGKLFSLSPAGLEAVYPQLPAFRKMLAAVDPAGKFRNAYLSRNLYPETEA